MKNNESLICMIKNLAERNSVVNSADVRVLIAALEEKDQRIADLENDEVRQRLANAEHQLHLADLAKFNLRASRKAQFRKRREAEQRLALVREQRDNELRTNAELEQRLQQPIKLPDRYSADCGMGPDPCGDWFSRYDVIEMLKEQGFKVEGE